MQAIPLNWILAIDHYDDMADEHEQDGLIPQYFVDDTSPADDRRFYVAFVKHDLIIYIEPCHVVYREA